MSEEAKAPEEAKVQEEAKQEVSLEEAESKTGIKDGAKNEDAVASAAAPSGEPALPSFFVEEEDRLRIEVDILFNKETGALVSVSRKGLLDPADFETLGFSTEWFEFFPVGYEDMTNYRQRCTVYRRDAQRALVDPIALRNYFVVWHLRDWTMRGRDGKKIELSFSEGGALEDESIKLVYKMNTTMLDVVLTLFEKDMMM
jgi:hypothetical protein